MAFPTTPLDVKVELQGIVTAGTWTDITSKVYTRDGGIQIQRGRQDETTSLQPGWARLTLDNRDGRFSPRNPTGIYYGKIGRNTPVRISALVGGVRMAGAGASNAPDSAGLSVVGDIDIRFDATLTDWVPNLVFVSKWSGAPNLSYRVYLNSDGYIVLDWSADGTNVLSATSTVPLSQTTGRQAIRATLDVNNGAAGRTITFYAAPTAAGTWTQLGTSVVQAGVTSIFDSTSTVFIGNTTHAPEVYSAEIRNGIGGALVGNPIFTSQAEGATSFADAQGNTWTMTGAATVTARRYRFYGEVSAWPQSWDISGNDVWVPVEAAGVLRRLGQGATALKGPIYRANQSDPNVVAYWPLEDAQDSLSMGSGLSGGPSMTIGGAPELASSTVFAVSEALPVLSGGSFSGPVNAYTATGTINASCLMAVPAAGDTSGATIMRIYTTGTAQRWDYNYDSSGALVLLAFDSLGAQILSQFVAFANNGKLVALVLELVQNGANIDYKMQTYSTLESGSLQFTGTLAGRTVGAATYIQLNPEGALIGTVVGHLTVSSAVPASLQQPIRGWAGETAGRRVERLCSEEGIPFTHYGDPDQSERMGVQKSARLLDLFAECETTDMGQVFESREELGLAYRTRDSRQYQGAALAMAYGDLSELVPVEDDQATRNDVTVSRIGGSTARITVDSGPLSTQAPPDGVGLYDESIELSLYTDSQSGHQAQWRATAGTVDEARYPDILARLETRPFATSTTLTNQALNVEHGDLITISGPPAWLPPDTIKQHTVGRTETLGPFAYGISFVCVPATPYGSTGTYGDGVTRYAAGNSVLNGAITSTALSAVTLTSPPVWTNNVSDFPLDIIIEGERITVSAISGTTTTQTWTFSARSVNGVVKAHPDGALVELADPDYYSL